MKYAYYPGCSLQESAREFDVSVRAVMAALGVELVDIPDWTCCGASAAEPVSALMNYALPARNLALAEQELPGLDVLAPCSACYLNLLKVNREVVGNKDLHARVNEALGASGLNYRGTVGVRHILDVLVNDIGLDPIKERIINDLGGMRVSAYYGCQILRPYEVFDDPRHPVSMDNVLSALGAKPLPWDMGNKCCGASLMVTHPEVAMHSVAAILGAADGSDAVATVCPLCQMNLEAYQHDSAAGGHHVPILYLTQLMGLAFGLEEPSVLLDKNMSMDGSMRAGIRSRAWRHEAPGEGDETLARET
ncbi:heterodisulfide reductase subunit B [Desulfomicrobium norvegicum]|uniref:Heterodisulfide reductase subunit B n=1 Tax=Desulfomicrobium norvegicum (strain DSM 1741 / NCIMB 8310) TaxID=52561 RepID=A0A8G2C0S0_DESNO|nr:CoB--CoM heterodisulfide reductase iron-sulfur subunit B family protein [Desulfomicrobium norvegicum]SFL31818.1 heterodisulfide reductase subunit B [Desulfomicrobium norvegicum]